MSAFALLGSVGSATTCVRLWCAIVMPVLFQTSHANSKWRGICPSMCSDGGGVACIVTVKELLLRKENHVYSQ